MRFDYVDIGTSDFDIGRGGYVPDKSYLLVEPIQYYLDKLDEYGVRGGNVVKCNAAVTHYNGYVDVWYINERVQKLYGLHFTTLPSFMPSLFARVVAAYSFEDNASRAFFGRYLSPVAFGPCVEGFPLLVPHSSFVHFVKLF